MEYSHLAALLVTQRRRLGLSQEEVATAAGLSLRTVQRLEKGESFPRGYTLQALAQALQLPVEALTEQVTPTAEQVPDTLATLAPPTLPSQPVVDVPTYVALMYLSAFSNVLLPGANIVLPLFLRYRKRHIAQIQDAGSRLLNFELVWTLVTYGGYLLLLAAQILLLFRQQPLLIWTPIVFLLSLNVLHAPLLLLGAWRARQGYYGGYPVGVRLF